MNKILNNLSMIAGILAAMSWFLLTQLIPRSPLELVQIADSYNYIFIAWTISITILSLIFVGALFVVSASLHIKKREEQLQIAKDCLSKVKQSKEKTLRV